MNPYGNQQPPPPHHRLHHQSDNHGAAGTNNNGMESNFPQHTQAPLPSSYSGYPTYALPNLNYSPSNTHFGPPAYPRQAHSAHPYPPSNTSPPYDRYGYNPNIPPPGVNVGGQGSGPGGPFINVQSPGSRRRESMPEMANERNGPVSMPVPSGPGRSGVVPEAPEPRMGQYMSYNQQPQQQQYEWPPVPGPSGPPMQQRDTAPMQSSSRRSTITRMTDDENAGGDPSDPLSETTISRPGSPHRSRQPQMTPLKTEADDDEADEEKMDHRKRKRNRTIRSCVPCHNHKRKCDRKRPCGRCTALGLTGTCVYEVDEARDMNDPTVIETDHLRKRIAELEQVVRELRQRNPARQSNAAVQGPANNTHTPVSSSTELDDKGQDNKKRRVIVDRFARFKIDEAAMAAVANAAAAGGENDGDTAAGGDSKRSSGEQEPGAQMDAGRGKKDYRAEPYTTYLLPGEEMVYDRIGRKTFLGAAAGKSMLRRLRELTSTGQLNTSTPGQPGEESDLLSVPEDAAFTGVFPDTRKTFPFTTIWSHENFSGEIIGLLPNKEQSEVLLHSWREEICSFFLAWHVPTLESEYRKFFAMSTSERMNVPLSSLSLFLMICSLGCVVRASRAEIVGHPDGHPGKDMRNETRDPKDLTSSRLQSELYLSGAYQALRLCSFLSNPSVHTIQAQILINVYLLNSERAADAWSQTGSLVRQCIAMGLHVDPASLDGKISIREAEVRRRIWWTVAGLDALLCLSFGRPSVINFYKTNLPQDREDETLSDAAGTATNMLPPSNVLNNETTEMTYHAAYFQLAIPSYELLDRLFQVDRKYSRSAIYGWFRPEPDAYVRAPAEDDEGHTYEGALRLAQDILQWYSHLPRGMRFEVEEDTAESLQQHYNTRRINQMLALTVKTFMIVMVLHRPYLRADPSAYPESSVLCRKAAHNILAAYRVGSYAKATIFWSWWTMSFRAFHAGAVCAFLAVREPGSERARMCMDDLKGVIDVLQDRKSAWNSAHPVQGDLCSGLGKLYSLTSAALQQKAPPTRTSSANSGHDRNRLSVHWTPTSDPTHPHHITLPQPGLSPDLNIRPGTPLSQIRGFPDATSPASQAVGTGDVIRQSSPLLVPQPFQPPESLSLTGDGFNGPESLALPQFWASMFGIKLEGDQPQSMSS